MQTGDKDGLKRVYTEDGELILNEDEEILVHEDNFIPQLKTTWGYFGGDYLVDPSKGEVYLTNQRLVYIVSKEQSIQRIAGTARTVMAPQSYAVQMKSASNLKNIDEMKGVRAYFEIQIKELLACEIKSGLVSSGIQVNVYILSKGEQIHLTFVLQENSKLLKRFKQMQVENLDELTNNLKVHFENTDWIYLKDEDGFE
jgi:hypothetical protein